MVLVGVADPNALNEQTIEAFANDQSVVVLTETTSNLHHPSFISNIDIITPFTADDFENFQPDINHFWRYDCFKRIKAFFMKNIKPKHHWHIDSLVLMILSMH
jgi:2-succinyl-5-enolpyruvyl-6-hydroxy-3-cyclohexene-1-carboxylate synthase